MTAIDSSLTADDDDISVYLRGEALFGDDLDPRGIRDWYQDESEGYADLGAGAQRGGYIYHGLNTWHGFRWLPAGPIPRVLGYGSAWGDEFAPIAERIGHLTILDPSARFRRDHVDGIPSSYLRPDPSGRLPFRPGSFDLITCLGVLHHVPNVSTVLAELADCLDSGGHLLLREPVISMGDWRKPRRGLTRRERGIPLHLLCRFACEAGLSVVREAPCMFPPVDRLWRLFGRFMPASQSAVAFDELCSRLSRWNLRYHRTRLYEKFSPTNAFFVLRKP